MNYQKHPPDLCWLLSTLVASAKTTNKTEGKATRRLSVEVELSLPDLYFPVNRYPDYSIFIIANI